MTEETNGLENANTFGDAMVSLLSSLVVGATVWGGLWSLVQIAAWAAVEYQDIVGFLKWDPNSIIGAVLVWLPLVIAFVVAAINYKKVLELEG